MRIKYTHFEWNDTMPVFLSENYLRASGQDYGWIAGIVDGNVRYVLPYTAHKRNMFKAIQFHSRTYNPDGECPSIADEKIFLNKVIGFLKKEGYDSVLQSPVYGFFRCCPDNVHYIPFGSYIVDLTKSEEELWNNIHRHHKRAIQKSRDKGLSVSVDRQNYTVAGRLIRRTLQNAGLFVPGEEYYRKMTDSLGKNVEIFTAFQDSEPIGCLFTVFSNYSAYCLHTGGTDTHLLQWEAMKHFKKAGVNRYDFVGARIEPEKGSKYEQLQIHKQRFGSTLHTGYIWKYPLSRPRSTIRRIMGHISNPQGDIIDQEMTRRKNLHNS